MDNTKRLLILDDETEIGEFLKPHFEKKGLQVLTCPSGEEAVKSLQGWVPDLVLLDYRLVGSMTGLDVVKKLREFNPAAKVIFLTSRLEDEVKKEAQELGVKTFLIKPVLMNALDEAIQEAIKS